MGTHLLFRRSFVSIVIVAVMGCARSTGDAAPHTTTPLDMTALDLEDGLDLAHDQADADPTSSPEMGVEARDMERHQDLDLASEVDMSTSPPAQAAYDTEFEGFGANARGGLVEGATRVVVTSMENDGPGSLRAALEAADGPTHITFARSGELALESYLVLPSHVTIDGRGADVTLTNCGVNLNGVEDVVLLDLTFKNIGAPQCDDSVQIIDSRDIAISHCSFDNGGMEIVKDIPDENISVVFGSRDITIEWNHFANTDKVMLLGNGDAPAEVDDKIRVTVHHNVFENTGRRHPFLRHGRVDMYNNLLRNWRPYLAIPYGARAQDGGELLLEANRFEQENASYTTGAFVATSGRLEAIDNVRREEWIRIYEASPEEVFERPYNTTIDDISGEAWRAMMLESAGATWDSRR